MGYLPKDYVGVHTRVENFHKDHKTDISIDTNFELQGEVAIFKAVVKTAKGTFSGSSFGKLGREKAFEKLETVAVGRALAFAGYEVKAGIASNEEMQVFNNNESGIQDIETTEEPKTIETISSDKKLWLNYENFVEIVEAGNTTLDQITNIIEQDGYSVSRNAKGAIAEYLNSGEIKKDLFFNSK